MSFSTPRAQLFAIMESLGFIAIKDAFDFAEIGNTKINKGFHVEQGTITSDGVDQNTTDIDNPQTLRFYEKGNKDSNITMTNTLLQLDTITNNILDISNKTDGVRNILFSEFSAVPHSDDNNDIIRGELIVNYKQIVCFSIS